VSALQGRFMAVNFASDLQMEMDYFAGPQGMGVDGIYTDCTRTSSEWLQLMCACFQLTPLCLCYASSARQCPA
jgi:hypothetical protein